MKNLVLILVLIIVLVIGCKKDETNHLPPTINLITGEGFVSGDTVLALGETFKIGIDASNSNVNLTNFIIKVETEVLETYLDSGMNTPSLHYEKYISKGIANSEKWIFIIRDKDGKSSEVSMNIGLDTSSDFGEIESFPNINLGAQNNSMASFYSLENNTYTLSNAFQNQEKVDLCYYYDLIETDENTIASPGANIDESVYPGNESLQNWTVRRTSRFKLTDVSKEEFLAATNDSLLIAAHGVADGNRKAKNLTEGKIFAFKNENGRIGLFRINSISGTNEGQVNISVKVQVK